MTLSTNSPTATAWTADPVRDFLCFRLMSLALAVLDSCFSSDEIEEGYRQWHKKQKRRKPRAVTKTVEQPGKELRMWMRDGGYNVCATALAEWGEMRVTIKEEDYQTEIRVNYDVDDMEMRSANVVSFSGDMRAAAEQAATFIAMIEIMDCDDEIEDEYGGDDFGDESEVPDSVRGHVRGLGAGGTGFRPRLEGIVERMVRAQGGRLADALTSEDTYFLTTTPEALWVIRDSVLAWNSGPRPLSHQTEELAWQALLEMQLENIRFKSERNHGWAIAMIERYQDELQAMARRRDIDIKQWQSLVIALDRAKITIRPEVRVASLDLAKDLNTICPPESDFKHVMEGIAEAGGGDPFQIARHLFESMVMMPTDFASVAVIMISDATLPALRDVLPLTLLAPENMSRRAGAAMLEQMAAEKRLTSTGLRRLIALRSWLPEAERPAVDQAIRKARLAGVDCAPWPAGQVRSLKATVVDGSGCLSLIGLAKDARRTMFTGILLKQGFGVRGAMLERNTARSEAETMLNAVASQVLSLAVDRSYLDRMVQHALWTGASLSRVPPLELLEVAESLGAAEWRAQRLDYEAELEQMLSGLPSGQGTAAAQLEAVRRSAEWVAMPELAGSWFEDDESAREICAAYSRTSKKLITALLEEVLEPRRDVWIERLVWMAMWSKAGKPGPGLPRWSDFALVARALIDGAPLAKVPLMTGIAKRTAVIGG